MSEKAAAIKRFEYSSLGKELKAQTAIAKKQYQKLDHTFEFDKIIKKEKPTLEKHNKSDLTYNSNYSFYKYFHNIKKFDNLSPESSILFYSTLNFDLNKFDKLKHKQTKKQQKRKMCIISFRII